MMAQTIRAAFTRRPVLPVLALGAVLAMLAMARPIDHDESQYVAAAVLVGEGLLPYRDFAYLQTPLQPILFGPIAAWLETAAYPGLRFLNALLGALAVLCVYRAARAGGADNRIALACAGLFASADILLFGTGVARNDALPAALFAGALWLIVADETRERTPARAALTGFLLAAAACAKGSYALPAAAYGAWALADWRHRPGWVALGAAPAAALVGWLAAQAPDAFWFDVVTFGAEAPRQHYLDSDRAYRLQLPYRARDVLVFLSLGAALPALVVVTRAAWAQRRGAALDRLLEVLIVAGLISAILPEPTWRQYLLPVLPPLFVRLARAWTRRKPERWERIVFAVFVAAGLAPTVAGLARATREGLPMTRAMVDGVAIGRALDSAGQFGPVATLSPQFLPAARRLPDPRFAAGPFYFRSRGLLSEADEARFRLLSADRLTVGRLPPVVLLGGEARWAAGNPAVDERLERVAAPHASAVLRINGGRFRALVLDPQATARPRAASSPE